MNTPIEARNAKLGPVVAEALKKRHFEAWYYNEPDAAIETILSLIPKDHTVSWGGSMTLAELGIQDRLEKEGYKLLDRDKASNPQERFELMRQGLLCDTYLSSSNAISEDGQLVNIDGFGNRVGAMCFGPRQVIVIAGMNKVTKSLDDAITRARTIAAPLNQQRFANNKSPCNVTGACSNCTSPDSICSYMVTTRLCKPAGRIKVILIGRNLGM
jgi:L-lactate utilization protein LutB